MLDVFAGTGAVGLESLSRGASRAVFIEHDRRAAALIAAQRRALRRRESLCYHPRQRPSARCSEPIDGDPFDLVMLDPPYDFEPLAAVLDAAARHLAPEGLLILEHAHRGARCRPWTGARRSRTVRSGDSALDDVRGDG